MISSKPPESEDWKTPGFAAGGWTRAVLVGAVNAEPWLLLARLPGEAIEEHPPDIRSALCNADPLTTALGRPSREQVTTARPAAATTLMALEMTNGATLTGMLFGGATKLASEKNIKPDEAVTRIYLKALGRKPTPPELATGREMVGPAVKDAGVEDLMWCVVMLPEFQLIR
jgi:hypothetical protein